MIKISRIYDSRGANGNFRVLVDRLWPRGVSRKDAAVGSENSAGESEGIWAKNIAPSEGLRERFHGGEINFAKFREQYLAELNANPAAGTFRESLAIHKSIELLFASADREENNAVVLKGWLEQAR